MLIPGNLRYFFTAISVLLLLCVSVAEGQTTDTLPKADTTKAKVDTVKVVQPSRQLVLGADIILPVRNYLETQRTGYEFHADYFLHDELYLAAEGGWGSSEVAYTDLKYNTRNTFLRLGFNKVLLPRENRKDWGGLMLGLRVAAAAINRSPVTYTIVDSLWGNSEGALGGKTFGGYWAEINAGVRVELFHGLIAGWMIRGKFLMNAKQFKDLAPLYVAGYGRGDKNAVFDFNFYLSYALRWKRS